LSQSGPIDDLGDFAAVAKPARGGTLKEYVAYEHAAGRPAFLAPDGTHAWIQEARGVLGCFPLEYDGPLDARFIRHVLKQPGIWMLTYLVAGTESQPANCVDYVCRGPNYRLESLSPRARRDIRRGLRSFQIRLCTWDEVAEHGYPAHADTRARHGRPPPSPDDVRTFVELRRPFPHFEVWGAWDGDALAAWMSVAKVDNWALIEKAPSRTAARRNCPNNALLYAATRHLLVAEGRAFVSNGRSSTLLGVRNRPLHRYKARMGYEPVPRRRAFALHWMLGLVMKPRAAAPAWEVLAELLPRVPALRKAAALARLVSGREGASLAWTRTPKP
jgi:hypothetical protein